MKTRTVARLTLLIPLLAFAAGLVASPGAPLRSHGGLEGYWKLNEGSGSTAGDSSGQGNTGTLVNSPTWTDGYAGKGLRLVKASNQYVTVPDSASLSLTGPFTLAAWIRPTLDSTDQMGILEKWDSGALNGYFLRLNSTGSGRKVVCQIMDGTGSEQVLGTSTVPLNTWTHVAGVYDGLTLRVYVDGALQASKSVTKTPGDGTRALEIGRDYGGNRFEGEIDEVRIYSRAMGPGEVGDLMKDTGLVGLWRLDENAGTTAGDASGEGNNGTLQNGPTWADGKIGKALSFVKASNQFVSVPDSASLSLRGPLTLSAWIHPTLETTDQMGILEKWDSTSTNGYFLRLNGSAAGRKLVMAIFDGAGSESLASVTPVSLNAWTHVAGVYDGLTLKLYLNGTLDATVAVTKTPTDGTRGLEIGRDYGGNRFEGKLDEARVYDRALSATEVADLQTANGKGLFAVYYDNKDWTGTFIQRTDSTVNFNWGTGSPDPAIGTDTFSAIWTGRVLAQLTETYTFYTTTDDGVRLWVDGRLIIDNPVDQGATEKSGTILLEAGRKYDLRMEYYENAGLAVAELRWSSPSTTKAIIPQTQLLAADNVLPAFVNATAQASDLTKVYARFSEPMDKATAETTSNYTLSGGLTVNSAALSSDKKVVTVTASGNVTIGTTTLAVSSNVKNLAQEKIAQRTKTIVAGNTNGVPDANAVALSLSTDSNQRAILVEERQALTLTITAPGTTATTVDLSQMKEIGGKSAVFMGTSGTATSATVTTSGGSPNQATIKLRGLNDAGMFQDDARLIAKVSGEERGQKFFTSVALAFTPQCVYMADQRKTRQDVQTTPVVANLQVLTTTQLLLGSLAGAATTALAAPQFPPTDTSGKATREFTPSELNGYALNSERLLSSSSEDNANGSYSTDHTGGGDHWRYGDPWTGPPPYKEDYCSVCQGGTPEDGSGPEGVDLSDGEYKMEAFDLTIQARSQYEFRRVYRSHNYRAPFGGDRKDFGENWTFSYASDFLVRDGVGSTAPILHFQAGQADMVYIFRGTINAWQPSRDLYAQLRLNTNPQPDVLELRDKDGTIRTYHDFSDTNSPNKNGRLKEIRDRNDNFMSFLYDVIDPDGVASNGDEKFVLTRVIDVMGREIRYQYYAATVQSTGTPTRTLTVLETGSGARGRLARVIDFKDNMDFSATPTQLQDFPGQVRNRTLVFDYDSEGNLVRVSRPAVAATPTGNNFTFGKTDRYKYIVEADLPTLVSNWTTLTNAQKDVVRGRLLHKLTRVWYPNEVRDTFGSNPADADAAEVLIYNTTATFDSPSSSRLAPGNFLGFVSSYTKGGTNGNGVPSGGTISYTFTDLNPSRAMPGGVATDYTILLNVQSLKTGVVDRNGNDAEYVWGAGRTLLEYREFTLDNFRAVEPSEYLLRLEHQRDRILRKRTMPEGNITTWTFNENSSDRFQQGNLIREIRTPDARGGDQPAIEMVYVYEPIYNRPCLIVSARGSNSSANGFTPPIAEPPGHSRTMTDPYDATRTLNLRYARVEYFDFQESSLASTAWPATSSFTPTTVDSLTVKATEVLLLRELMLAEGPSDTERADSIRELRTRLSNNLTKLGLGDLNGDGITDPVIAGNTVRTVFGSPVLQPGTNQAALEAAIDGGDLINQTLPYDQGGTFEGTVGTKLQTIVWMYQYNKFGQMIQTISPEGNVTTHEYFPENDPDGDGNVTPAPADGRTVGTQDSAANRVNGGGGYVHFTVVDRTRTDSYVKLFDQAGTNKSMATFHNNNTAPAATDIKTCACIYDDVGNLIQRHDPRGIRTDFFVNELDQVVQITGAADISEASNANPPDPLIGIPSQFGPLTAFAYKSRTSYDFNDNVVLSQVEDRGNTSSVDGSGLGTLPSQATDTTMGLSTADGTGSEAWVDTLSLYDRLDNLIEIRAELDGTRSLNSKYRYDGNQHQVLVIHPEGNADSWIYDERELIFQVTIATSSRPSAGKYGSGDPTNFNRPGGSGTEPSTVTYNYDKNRNLVEMVDAADTDGDTTNNSTVAGNGDRIQYVYDGYDRQVKLIDPDGNFTITMYDPDSNPVRSISVGDPIDDGVGQGDNRTLTWTETVHDELSRLIVTHQVLFKTPEVSPARTPTLTDTSAIDTLAAYLADASSDGAGLPQRAIDLGAVTTNLTVLGRVTALTEYDRESRGTFSIQDDLDVYRTDYDGASRVVKTTDSALSNGFSGGAFTPGNISGNLVETAYDDNSNAIETKETDVTTVPNVANANFRMTMLYDSLDRLQTRVDSTFVVISSTEHAHATDSRYNSRSTIVAHADAVGPVNSRNISRRGLGSTASIRVNDFGNVTRSRYDGLSRLLESESILTASGQGDGLKIGATIEGVQAKSMGDVDYTDCPARDSNQSGDGLISIYWAYDDNFQTLALRDDNGNTTAYVFDNQNRILCEVKGLAFTGTTFPAINCPDSGTTGDSGAFVVALRGGASVVNTEATGTENTYAYDKDSNLVQLKNEGDVNRVRTTITCTYDALDRKKTCVILNGTGSLFIGTRSPDAQTPALRWEYDGLSRKTFCLDNNEPTPTSDDVECRFFYDSLSRKVEETQKIGTLGSKGFSCSYDIVASGAIMQPSMCTYPDGRKVHTRYDTLDRLVRRFDDDGTTQYSDIGKYEYIGKWRVAAVTYQNKTRLTHIGQVGGQNAEVGFDGLRRIVNHRWESFTTQALGAGTLVVGFEHQDGASSLAPLYDRANNKRIEFKTHDSGKSEQYKYDSVYRLASTGSGNQGVDARGFERGTFTSTARTSMSGGVAFFQDWDLEGLGNWSRLDDNARVETRTHSDFNEIDQRTVGGQNAQLTYDKNGNTTDTGYSSLSGQSFPGGGLRLEWDALNRLRKVFQNSNTPGSTGDDVLVGEYTYDCENRRLRKVVNPGPSQVVMDFYYEQWTNLEERDGTDAVTNQYVFGNYQDEAWTVDDRRSGGTIASLNDGSGTRRHFYHCNTLSHIYGLTDEAGLLREAYEYDAYGRQTVISDGNDADVIVNFNSNDIRTPGGASTINASPWMYTGQRLEPESELIYCKERYLSTGIGRFLTRDPVGYQMNALGLYEYCSGRPTFATDPFGLLARSCQQVEAKNWCGPDITTRLKDVLMDVEGFYDKLSAKDKNLYCAKLTDPTDFDNWDIIELHSDFAWITDPMFAPCPTGPNCMDTVTVDKKCFYRGSANYALYGKMMWLCGGRGIDRGKEEEMVWLILGYKFAAGGSSAANKLASLQWAKRVFRGWPDKAQTPDNERACTPCPQMKRYWPFTFKWYKYKSKLYPGVWPPP